MSKYLKYDAGKSGAVIIEVEGEPSLLPKSPGSSSDKVQKTVESVGKSFEEAVLAVKPSVEAFITMIQSLPVWPEEVELTFGLKASGETGGVFVVAKAGAEANFCLKMTWKRSGDVKDGQRALEEGASPATVAGSTD